MRVDRRRLIQTVLLTLWVGAVCVGAAFFWPIEMPAYAWLDYDLFYDLAQLGVNDNIQYRRAMTGLLAAAVAVGVPVLLSVSARMRANRRRG
jgi:hypothetical protein